VLKIVITKIMLSRSLKHLSV